MGLRGWLDKRASASMSEEAQRFLVSIRGADQTALDSTMALTLYWAAIFKKNGRDLYLMCSWIQSELLFPTELGKTIRTLQANGTPESAVGVMTWLHSARAILYPDIRLLGREIWGELAKATDDAQILAEDMAAQVGVSDYLGDVLDTPIGLERVDR